MSLDALCQRIHFVPPNWRKIAESTASRDPADVARTHIRIALEDAAQSMEQHVEWDTLPPGDTTHYSFSYSDGQLNVREFRYARGAKQGFKKGSETTYDIVFGVDAQIGVCMVKPTKWKNADGAQVSHSLDPQQMIARLSPLEEVKPFENTLVPIVVISAGNYDRLQRYAQNPASMFHRFQKLGFVVPFYTNKESFEQDVRDNLKEK